MFCPETIIVVRTLVLMIFFKFVSSRWETKQKNGLSSQLRNLKRAKEASGKCYRRGYRRVASSSWSFSLWPLSGTFLAGWEGNVASNKSHTQFNCVLFYNGLQISVLAVWFWWLGWSKYLMILFKIMFVFLWQDAFHHCTCYIFSIFETLYNGIHCH